MPLTIEKELARKNGESNAEQAKRIFEWLKTKAAEQPFTSGFFILFSANNEQAQLLHQAREDGKPIPDITGSGQAGVVKELIQLIKRSPTGGKFQILPIATSLRGGSNGRGNFVSQEMITRDLDALQKTLQDDVEVFAFPGEDGKYGIGGAISNYWFTEDHTSVEKDGQTTSQGAFVQAQLADLSANKLYTGYRNYNDGRSISERTHYAFANPSKRWFKHLFEVTIDEFKETFDSGNFNRLKAEFKNLKGDALKAAILDKLRKDMNALTTPAEVNQFVTNFPMSLEFKILAKGQGFLTHYQKLKTDSLKAFEAIVAEEQLKRDPPKPTL